MNLPRTETVIILTRLGNGMPIAVNPDLIERAEHTPDTVLTLVDGHKLVVEEPLDDVIALIRSWRASIAAEAITLARMSTQEAPHTSNLTGHRPDADQGTDLQGALIAERTAHGSPMGQILRLPSREV
jgi:flagellar protein FlbD